MAEKRKSIVDESLLEAQKIQKAFEQNAKEILSNTMGKEIEQLVKESLEEDDEEEVEGVENDEEATDLDLSDEGGEDTEDLDLDFGDEESEEGEDNDELDIDFDSDDEGEEESDELDFSDLDSDEEGGEDLDLNFGDEEGGEDVETIDLTGEEDITNIINVYKKMGPEDEIQVVRTGNSIDIKDNRTNSEYRVELGGQEMSDDEIMGESVMYEIEIDEDEDFMENDDPMDDDDDIMSAGGPEWNLPYNDEDETMYEIELDDEFIDTDPMDEKPMGEASRTLGSGRKFGRRGLDKPRTAPSHLRQESTSPRVSNLLKENSVLKQHINGEKSKVKDLMDQNKKLVEALTQLRNNLQEIAVFNSNLTYSVRLMSENTTTKEEKVEIIKRMDSAKTIKESKDTYKSLVRELSNKKPLTESINDKLNQTKTSGAQISESKVYVNPELEKMKKLWNFKYNNK
jgi:hypothetical protein